MDELDLGKAARPLAGDGERAVGKVEANDAPPLPHRTGEKGEVAPGAAPEVEDRLSGLDVESHDGVPTIGLGAVADEGVEVERAVVAGRLAVVGGVDAFGPGAGVRHGRGAW